MSEKREINLIPDDVIMRGKVRRRIWLWAGIIKLIVIVFIIAYALEAREIGAVEGEIADLSLKKLQMEEKIKQLNILRDKRDMLAKKKIVISRLLNKRSLSYFFSEIEKVMNNNVWLTSLDFKDDLYMKTSHGEDSEDWVETGYFIVKKDRSKAQKDPQNKAPEVSTVLQGRAKSNKDLANFLEQLTKSGYFSEVDLIYSQESTYGEIKVVEFEIEMLLKLIQKV